MYFAMGIRDLLKSTQLNLEFFYALDDFQLHFIEMCFKQELDEKMGMLTELELYNYHIFEEFKIQRLESMYGVDADYFKKAG